jgi:uncharacterized alkaline shock family protein YloU
MEGHSLIASEILASYAGDAALEIGAVQRLVGAARPRHDGVRISTVDGRVCAELHLALEWGSDAATVGEAVQTRVTEYLSRMTDLDVGRVDVVVDEVAQPPVAS